MLPYFAIGWFLLCGIAGIILWILMCEILERNGKTTNYFIVLPKQYIRFLTMIKSERNRSFKNKYLTIFWGQIALIPFFLLGELLIFLIMKS